MLGALSIIFSVQGLIAMWLGLVMGIIFGAIPGLTSTLALSLLVPVTYGMDPAIAMLIMCGSYCGAEYGGSISAILLGVPGTPAAAATKMDGYPMMQQGKAWNALRISAWASAWGGLFSAVVLIFLGPTLANFALKFGPPEFFAIGLFGMSIICSLDEKSMMKALISGGFGIFLATIGMDVITGYPRFTFGNVNLLGGLELVPTLVGLFAVPEVIGMLEKKDRKVSIKEKLSGAFFPTKEERKKTRVTILRGSVIGTIIGIIPGTGSAISCFMAWNEEKRASKYPEKFGTGVIEGVAAPESANNSVTGGTLIPTMALGVPGNSSTAILLGALMLHGLTPGPNIFNDQPVVVNCILVGLFVVNVMLYFTAIVGLRGFMHVLRIPIGLVSPVIASLTIIGCYSIRNNAFDVMTALVIGIIAYFMKKGGFPVTPIVVALILTETVENAFFQSMIITENGYWIFLTRPLSLILILLTVGSIGWAVYKNIQNKKTAEN